jgi:hypothetical protein
MLTGITDILTVLAVLELRTSSECNEMKTSNLTDYWKDAKIESAINIFHFMVGIRRNYVVNRHL